MNNPKKITLELTSTEVNFVLKCIRMAPFSQTFYPNLTFVEKMNVLNEISYQYRKTKKYE